jgi:hypothetical protein
MNVSILQLQSERCGQISANAKRRNAASAYYRTDDRLTTPAAMPPDPIVRMTWAVV